MVELIGATTTKTGLTVESALDTRSYQKGIKVSKAEMNRSITAGTAMHHSKLPLTAWFWAAHLMATHSNGMSARQLEDQLGVTYKTAWLLTQKLRRSMVDPDREPLEGVVEVDQAEIPFREGDAFFEPGDAGKMVIIGAVEVISIAASITLGHDAARQIPRYTFRPHPPCHDRRQIPPRSAAKAEPR